MSIGQQGNGIPLSQIVQVGGSTSGAGNTPGDRGAATDAATAARRSANDAALSAEQAKSSAASAQQSQILAGSAQSATEAAATRGETASQAAEMYANETAVDAQNAADSAAQAAQVLVDAVKYPELAAPAGAELVGFTQPGVDAVTRTSAEKLAGMPACPEDFGAAADGVTDDSTAIARMLVAAAANGFSCQLTGGKTYLVEAGVSVSQIPVFLDFNGGRIVRGVGAANVPALSIDGVITDVTPVLSVAAATYDFSGDGNLSDVSAITLAAPIGLAAGDIIKIVADDLIPSSDPAANERVGETVEIGAVAGPVLYTYSPLRETYATTIRIGRLTRRDCTILNADVSDAPGFPAARNAALIQIESMVAPSVVSAFLHDSASYGAVFKSCHAPRTRGFRAERLRTSASNLAYGYGVYEISCVDGLHEGPSGEFMRHVFTTGCLTTSAGSTLLKNFGGVIDSRVEGGVGFNTENAAWDTHSDSLRVTFKNCASFGKPTGAGNSRFAFQLRGRGDTIEGCDSLGVAAVVLRAPYSGDAVFRIRGLRHRVQPGVTAAVGAISCAATGSNPCRVEIDADVETLAGAAMIVTGGVVTGSIRAKCAFGALASYAAVRLEGASSFDGELSLDFTGATGTNSRAVKTTTSAGVAVLRRLSMRKGNSDAWFVGDLTSLDGKIVVSRLEADFLPTNSGGSFTAPGAAATRFVSSAFVAGVPQMGGVGALANGAVSIGPYSADTQVLDVPLTAARTVTLPTASIQPGRRLKFTRTANSTGAFAMSIGGVASLSGPSTSAEVVWNGTAWVPL